MERDLRIYDGILLEVPIEATDEVAFIFKETVEEAGRRLGGIFSRSFRSRLTWSLWAVGQRSDALSLSNEIGNILQGFLQSFILPR